ncbi:hypothetical protein B0H66DRAFT_474545 [Apodospora peruviana]|uniref:RING-type E3 ubiquitin transferase n=1 Tax=Apodospora peruviana TaxID=516989 RepID=A0AAE0IDR7_9PEZI|nr:hypothetical protein B0H66DRAFT_474545 [Apodospora peruviana]
MGPDPARFPNTRRRTSLSVHDAPTSSSRAAPTTDATMYADPDTCRICRGEGSADEPLFYPCKCSGSIKFVHQDCLMEWLSHSQKKHCELCKTPFRFTKLYAHDMPKALPFYVFVSHMAKYLFRNLLVWLRAALVASVWLGWLPYLMRSIWSFLFWISDEGLGGGSALFGRQGSAAGTSLDRLPSSATVCPSSPLFVATTSVATIGGSIGRIPFDSARLVNGLYNVNLTSADPLYSTILRLLFGTVGLSERPSTGLYNSSTSAVEKVTSVSTRHPSLLSEVGFLRNLTRNPSINRVVIAVLEGQIITILVIVCFILIILVRDYVVQQQPEINMRAAFAAAENIEGTGENEENHHVHEDDEDDEIPPLEDFDGGEDISTAHGPFGIQTRDQTADRYDHDGHLVGSSSSADLLPIPERRHSLLGGVGSPADLSEAGGTTVHEYMQIYREAGGDPERILNIVKDRQLEDRLDYWIKLTRSMMDRNTQTEGEGSQIGEPIESEGSRGSGQSSEWTWPDEQHSDGYPGEPKGKEKEVVGKGEDSTLLIGSVSRPRANTDGPVVHDTIHPLANNNWSFAQLDTEPPEPDINLEQLDRLTNPAPDDLPRSSGRIPSEPVTDGGQTEQDSSEPRPSQPVADPQATNRDPQQPDVVLQQAAGDTPPPNRNPAGLVDRVADFMWRDIDDIDPAELPPIDPLEGFGGNDFGDLAGVIQDDGLPEGMERDREVVEAAVAAGLDPEAIEDAEDLEGVLELLGMRGPVAGLFQNAIFCAFLVSITIFLGIFVPYNIGRITVWTVANPMRPARMLFSLSKFVQDCALVVIGFASCVVSYTIQILSSLFNVKSINTYMLATIASSWSMTASAANRIVNSFMSELPIISASEMRNFSAISHEALLSIKEHISLALSTLGHIILFIFGGDYSVKRSEAVTMAANVSVVAWHGLNRLPEVVSNPSSWVINLSLPETTSAINPELAYWNGTDRFWAIIGGYIALSLVAGLYLRRGSPFSSGQTGQEWEASIIDGLNQASGVMKVILIIGIEMLVFPLYCGMLLDVALLPLFEATSMKSRLLFTVNYPVTSIFVHWFVGTGYMFHFALFVSMCRKIMRKGVLYFIRDPDDPEFHPVRDVLERNVTTQLRKILFSAFVYGALVMVCLGGVVWGLALSLPSVLPIHYSSNEPVLEFPVDLLFYNFIMPLAAKFFRPADGLHAMYTWWFRKCARALRITWFLFGERQVDEEGHMVLRKDSPHRTRPWWRILFLELDSSDKVVPKTWRDIFEGGTAEPAVAIPDDEMARMDDRKSRLVLSGQLIPDGRFVRTPASDQVKIPKGRRVFLDVTENNLRRDGRPDRPETDLYSTNQYQFVYVPPNFRLRVFLFIMFIWIFAAVTGVGFTIIPLMFGRRMFQFLIPGHILTNDIYAFSIGIYVLGSIAYTLFHAGALYGAAKRWITSTARFAYDRGVIGRVFGIVFQVARVVYAYVFIILVFPLLVTSIMELYALIPLREFMYSVFLGRQPATDLNSTHTIRVIQSWTVGLLYLKLSARGITTFFGGTRLAVAMRAVLRRGWFDPDLAVLTRAFIVPGLALWLGAVTTPLLFARFTISRGMAGPILQAFGDGALAVDQPLDKAYQVLIYRLSFPLMALGVAACFTLWSMVGVFRTWKVRIRDEAYLIGERLHNFGVVNGPPRMRGSWRATGSRL